MDKTQRQDDPEIISSDPLQSTFRINSVEGIISSANNQPVISSLADQIILNDVVYTKERLIDQSGESEVFLVKRNNEFFVFKYYYSSFKPKEEILKKLKEVRHPNIIRIHDFGYFEGRFFEVMEYMEGGMILDFMPIDSYSRIKELMLQLAEALNVCHQNNIVHRDIKPHNIFYRDKTRSQIAIGDFGISSTLDYNNQSITTSKRTSIYASPELFTQLAGKVILDKSVDFYALGMSLLHLYTGKIPFEDLDEVNIIRQKNTGNIQFPEMDDDVKKLIQGLIIVNPADRWGYEQIKGWLRGDEIKTKVSSVKIEYKPYIFGKINGENVVVNSPEELAYYMELRPDMAEGHLYRNTIAKWVEDKDPGLFNALCDIVDKQYPNDHKAGITKALYILDPAKPFIGLNNSKFGNFSEIASHFETNTDFYRKELSYPTASFYCYLEAKNRYTEANKFREYFTKFNPELALNSIIYDLESNNKQNGFVLFKGICIKQPSDLLTVDDVIISEAISHLANPYSKLSLWFTNFHELDSSIATYRKLNVYNTRTFSYALQEGFNVGSAIVKNSEDFNSAFQQHFDYFFSESSLDNQNRENAHYWLKNYCNSSLWKPVSQYLIRNEVSPEVLLKIIEFFIQKNSQDWDFLSLDTILVAKIKETVENDNQYYSKIISLFKTYFNGYFNHHFQQELTKSNVIHTYFDYAELNHNIYPAFIKELTQSLESDINKGIILFLGSQEKSSSVLLELRKKITVKLKEISPDLKILSQIENENQLLSERINRLKNSISKEKEEKINVIKSAFQKIIDQRRKEYSTQAGRNHIKKIINQIILFVLGIILVKGASMVNSLNTFLLFLAGWSLGIYLILLFRKGKKSIVPIAIYSVLYYIIGGPLIFFLSPYLPNLQIIGLFCCLIIYFGVRVYNIYNEHKKALQDIQLLPNEQIVFDNNLLEVDRYFLEKENYDIEQEKIRVLLMDERN